MYSLLTIFTIFVVVNSAPTEKPTLPKDNSDLTKLSDGYAVFYGYQDKQSSRYQLWHYTPKKETQDFETRSNFDTPRLLDIIAPTKDKNSAQVPVLDLSPPKEVIDNSIQMKQTIKLDNGEVIEIELPESLDDRISLLAIQSILG